jgi:hypothetical protein
VEEERKRICPKPEYGVRETSNNWFIYFGLYDETVTHKTVHSPLLWRMLRQKHVPFLFANLYRKTKVFLSPFLLQGSLLSARQATVSSGVWTVATDELRNYVQPVWPSTDSVVVAQVFFIHNDPGVRGSEVWVCDRSLAGIARSNPFGGRNVSLSLVNVVCFQVEVSATGRSLVIDSDVVQQ